MLTTEIWNIIVKYVIDDVAILLNWIDVRKIDWRVLSGNPNAIDLLMANQDKIDWYYLSYNTNAIDLLTANQDKIYWQALSGNPSIFTKNIVKYNSDITPFYISNTDFLQ